MLIISDLMALISYLSTIHSTFLWQTRQDPVQKMVAKLLPQIILYNREKWVREKDNDDRYQ